MIVFGWNSYEQDSCLPSSLGLPSNLDEQYKIIKRQKYFHLFWIPFFSIGSDFVLKAPNNKLYEPSEDLKTYLYGLGLKHKFPWFTFIGPILLALGFIVYSIHDKITSEMSRKENIKLGEKQLNENIEIINNTRLGHYFSLVDDVGKYSYLKVVNADDKNIKCVLSYKKINHYNSEELPQAFISDSAMPSFDTVMVAKKDLIKSLKERTEIIKNGPRREINKITFYYEPSFEPEASLYKDGKFMYLVKNVGVPVKFVSISSQREGQSAIIDINSIAKDQAKGIFTFSGIYNEDIEPYNSSLIQFVNDRDDKYTYRLTIKGNSIFLIKEK